jgi:ketosteroid isomerase-like protein
MSAFDPMAATIDWLDAYRACSLGIVNLYADDAALECGCGGQTVLYGRDAITAYWRLRFVDKPAGELQELQMNGNAVVVSYHIPDGIVKASLVFDREGHIARSQCGPAADVIEPYG